MRKALLLAGALRRHARGIVLGDGGPRAGDGPERDARGDEQDDHDRRHVPAQRAGVVLCADPARDGGVLQLHQLAQGKDGKRGVYGRQIVWKYYDDEYNPVADRPADEQADPPGQGLRGRRLARHGAQPGDPAAAQQPQDAAAAGLDGRQLLGHAARRSSRGRPAGSPTTSPRARSTGSGSLQNKPNAKIAVFYQNDDYGKDYLNGLKQGLGDQAEPDRVRAELRGHRHERTRRRSRASGPREPTRGCF